jgi:hypothetical protein
VRDDETELRIDLLLGPTAPIGTTAPRSTWRPTRSRPSGPERARCVASSGPRWVRWPEGTLAPAVPFRAGYSLLGAPRLPGYRRRLLGESHHRRPLLADELGIEARFLCSDVYSLPDVLAGQFDIVVTSYGVMTWLPDIHRWAQVAAHFVRPVRCSVAGAISSSSHAVSWFRYRSVESR